MFSFSKIWKYLWPEMRKFKISFALVFIGYTIGIIFNEILKPYLYKEIIDTISSTTLKTPEILHKLSGFVVMFVVIVLIMNIGYRLGDYANSYFQSNVMKRLHDMAFGRLLRHSYAFFSNNFSGSLVAKVKRIPQGFETLMDVISYQILFSFVNLAGVLVVLFLKAPTIGYIFLGWAVFYVLVTCLFLKKQMVLDTEKASADSSVTGFLSDSISNILNVKVFSQKKAEQNQFGLITQDEETKRRKSWYYGNSIYLLQGILTAGLQVVVTIITIKMWYNGTLSVGMFVLIQTYMMGLFDILWNLGKSLKTGLRSITEMVEAVEIFEQIPDIQDPKNPESSRVKEGHILFNKMSFEYIEGQEVFIDFHLDISSGEKIGLVGHSGSGKSTITKLLLRFADVQKGEILIDGQNIAHITQDDLRNCISYVPQEPILFHRTIKENIAYAKPDATDEEIIEAAKKAHAHEFISGLQFGYDTLVGERGVKLSGGERQRVAIARAMLKQAPILILDEATSSLDSVSESYIQDAFGKLMENKTTIVIAHRLSTIQKMDRIIVLDKGKIIEEGTHKELLVKDGTYADLWNHQTGGFIE